MRWDGCEVQIDDAVTITDRDFKRFCEERGVKPIRNCPLCNGPVQFGLEDEEPDRVLLEAPVSFLRAHQTSPTILQQCGNCGYSIGFALRPLLDWKGLPDA